ncbi:MAG: VWA domain-containing protein [Ruminococcus sp.]|nr:VWA domain-containing protein [Ruminococcus sp.]
MMFCEKCGAPMQDGSIFCERCGNRVMPPQNSVPLQQGQAVNPFSQPQQNVQQFGQQQPVQYQQPMNGYPPPQYQQPYQDPYYQDSGTFVSAAGSDKKSNTAIIIALTALTAIILTLCVVLLLIMTKDSDESDKGGGGSKRTSRSVSENISPGSNGEEEVQPTEKEKLIEAETLPAEPDNSYEGIAKRTSERKKVNINYVSSDVSDYPNVKVYFTVEDEQGDTVDLYSPNVAVKESVTGGAELEREVKSVEQLKGREGVSFDIVADKSGSMRNDMDSMQRVMGQFVDALDYKSGDRAELIAFDSFVMYMCTYTSDTALLKNGINNMEPYGETALYDALYEGVTNAGAQRGARCVIGFTDGSDNQSSHTSQEVIDLANFYSVPIFIIGTGGSYDYTNITSATGGQYWSIDSINDMSQVLDQIYSQEKDMYCMEYVSDGSADKFASRDLELAVEDDNYGAITRMTFTPTETLKKQAHASRYEVVKADLTWEEANAECIKRGGHLITITSDDEMAKASKLAQDAGLKYVWMGGYTSIRGSSAFGHWITGENFNYQKWYPGEPSRNDKDGEPEMYLMLWHVTDDWTWNDQRNDVFHIPGLTYFSGSTGYICEYED